MFRGALIIKDDSDKYGFLIRLGNTINANDYTFNLNTDQECDCHLTRLDLTYALIEVGTVTNSSSGLNYYF